MRLVGLFRGGERDGMTYCVHPDQAKAGVLKAPGIGSLEAREYAVVVRKPGEWDLAPDFSAIVVFDLYEVTR